MIRTRSVRSVQAQPKSRSPWPLLGPAIPPVATHAGESAITSPREPEQAPDSNCRNVDAVGFERAVSAGIGPGKPLSAQSRSYFGPRFGEDFASVRVHDGSGAAALSQSIGARAFTAGRHIYFAEGQHSESSSEGRRLIAHELAHVAHQARSTQRRSGIAPESARAEHHADSAAAKAIGSEPMGGVTRDIDQWGPAWTIHRQAAKKGDPLKITKFGARKHRADIRRGDSEPPIGEVEVRTGEEIELAGGTKMPNMIAIAYSGNLTSDSRWLQFVWFTVIADTAAGSGYLDDNVTVNGVSKSATSDPKSPKWSVDTVPGKNPFYEAGGVSLRKDGSTTIFDHPSASKSIAEKGFEKAKAKVKGGAKSITFTAHFETYLIQEDVAVYEVTYQASTAFTQNAKGKVVEGSAGYTVGPSGPVSGLPADRKKMLHAAFPAYKMVK